MKPSEASDCHFCKSEMHPDTGAVNTLICIHPKGQDLKIINNPKYCVKQCSLGIYKNKDIDYNTALCYSNLKNLYISESWRFISSLIPTIILIIKVLEKK